MEACPVNEGAAMGVPTPAASVAAAALGANGAWRDVALCLVAVLRLLWRAVAAAGAHALLLVVTHTTRHAAGLRDTAVAAASAAKQLTASAADAARRAVHNGVAASGAMDGGGIGGVSSNRCESPPPQPGTPPVRAAAGAPGSPRAGLVRRSLFGRAAAPAAAAAAAAAAPAPFPRATPIVVVTAGATAPLLPPQRAEHAGRLTVVLDLDATLVGSVSSSTAAAAAATSSGGNGAAASGGWVTLPRPGVGEFLPRLAAAAEVVLWTAAGAAHARRQLRALDPEGRFFVAAVCGGGGGSSGGAAAAGSGSGGGGAVSSGPKDLALLGRDLARTVMVDDSAAAMALQPSNGVLVPPYRPGAGASAGGASSGGGDRALLSVVLPLLLSLAEFDGDVRPILERQIGLSRWLEARGKRPPAAA